MRRGVAKTLGYGAALTIAALACLELLASKPSAIPSGPQPAYVDDESSESQKLDPRLAPRTLGLPGSAPIGLSCEDARRIVKQARAQLAAPPELVDPKLLAEATADWLDPHGLWSAAPDAPLSSLLQRRARELVAELEADPEAAPCTVAEEAGAQLSAWMAHLQPIFDEAAIAPEMPSIEEAFRLVSSTIFEDRGALRPARELARELGLRIGASRAFGPSVGVYAQEARRRFLPELPASSWASVLLAAAVRAYVPQIDPHGGWAPLDEETSLYELDLEDAPPRKLWGRMSRAPLGARIEEGALAELLPNDLVLEILRVPTAGLSVEQLEQLAIVDDSEEAGSRAVVVLREGETTPRLVDILPAEERPSASISELLPAESIAYGDGEALVVTVTDVPDDLGLRLEGTIASARLARSPRAILLDLRGNGGGSTDGASDALSLFLPGATLFPMLRRDGAIEVERAKEPLDSERWTGPVATLVDGDTASAAEMIAGALAAYRRGPIVGNRTYGKGCAQEYFDDDARTGLLRLTTLVYSLPDGTPVQRVGLLPTLQLGLVGLDEREASLPRSLPPWRGPDVRDVSKIVEVPWPSHRGRLGPCRDEVVCRALRALGSPRPAIARGTGTARK